MEAWARAYKAINGKTPTKKQCETLAPPSLLPKTDALKVAARKSPRKSASLKRPLTGSLISPAKKRRMLDFGGRSAKETKKEESKPVEANENAAPISPPKKGRFLDFGKLQRPEPSTSDSVNQSNDDAFGEAFADTFGDSAPEKPLYTPSTSSSKPSTDTTTTLLFNSPLKNWPTAMRLRQSPRKTPQKKHPTIGFPTPSPQKTLAVRAAGTSSCRRLHHLLNVRTPVKNENEEPEEVEVFEDERPEGAKDYKPRDPYARKSKNTNFVSLNMRKKNYVKGKPGKFSKKKFMNSKFNKFKRRGL